MAKTAIKFDTLRFRTRLSEYVKVLKLNGAKAIEKQSKLLVRDLINATPPFNTRRGVFGRSFGGLKTGKAAVARDVRKAFAPASTAKMLRSLPARSQKLARSYVRRGEFEKLQTMLQRMGGNSGSTQREYRESATVALHNKRRDRTGRVRKGLPILVKNAASINTLIKLKPSHVGTWKSAWMPAAKSLGVKGIPQWISTKNGKGGIVKKLKTFNPMISLINAERGETGRDLQIAKAALQNRDRSMANEMKVLMDRAKKKARL